MNYNEIASQYREISTRGSHPVGLVGKMYDAILEDFRRALSGIATGDIQGRTAALNHALLVIAELQSVLDHERGGEVAHRLNGFYNVTRSLIVDANIHATPQHVQRLVDLYLPLRQAWKHVEADAAAGKLNLDPVAARPELTATAASGEDSPAEESKAWSA